MCEHFVSLHTTDSLKTGVGVCTFTVSYFVLMYINDLDGAAAWDESLENYINNFVRYLSGQVFHGPFVYGYCHYFHYRLHSSRSIEIFEHILISCCG